MNVRGVVESGQVAQLTVHECGAPVIETGTLTVLLGDGTRLLVRVGDQTQLDGAAEVARGKWHPVEVLAAPPPRWTTIEGTVCSAPISLRTRTDETTNSFGKQETHVDGPETIAIQHGETTYTMPRDEVVWAHSRRDSDLVYKWLRLSRGDRAIACGVLRDGTLRADGKQPVVLLATPHDDDPRAYVPPPVRRLPYYIGFGISALALIVEAALWR